MEKQLDKYIKEKHTQEECVGFIDGFAAAMESVRPTINTAFYRGVAIGAGIGIIGVLVSIFIK